MLSLLELWQQLRSDLESADLERIAAQLDVPLHVGSRKKTINILKQNCETAVAARLSAEAGQAAAGGLSALAQPKANPSHRQVIRDRRTAGVPGVSQNTPTAKLKAAIADHETFSAITICAWRCNRKA